MRFNKLTVVSLNDKKRRGKLLWDCVCDCGVEKVVMGEYLKNGDTSSCGCFKKEKLSSLYTKHGAKGTPEYSTWCKIKERCRNKNCRSYKHYGGRGISVCESWVGENGFINFLNDMGKRPSSIHSIDRIDVNGDYCKGNCKWATCKQQQNNRRNNKIVEYNGVKGTLSQIANIFNVNYELLRLRIRWGWSIEESITKKPRNVRA